ncbi:MAG TPA: tetratricopeptide repeat protein [Candidatus Obscuribacterales bacterium]
MLKPADGSQERLKQAVRLHQAGRLAEADAICRQVLQMDPACTDALNLAGVLASQQGDFAAAIARLGKAIALAPKVPQYVCNLALAYAQQGNSAQAIRTFLAALRLDPDLLEARASLGALYQNLGDTAAAMACYRAVLERAPGSAQIHYNLGTLCYQAGQADAAIGHYRQALGLAPGNASAANNLGNLLFEQGELDQAATAYMQALKARPDHLNACYHLGCIRLQQGRLPEALAAFEQVIGLNPDHADALNKAGVVLQQQHRYPEALAAYLRAERLEPGNVKIQLNLAETLLTLGRYPEALECCQAALRFDPTHAEIHNNLGIILEFQGHFSQAIAAYHREIALNPGNPKVYNNLANALRATGQLDQALAAYRRAMELQPDYAVAEANLPLTLNYLELPPERIYAEHRAWGERMLSKYPPTGGHANLPDPERRLRVGYLSTVFRDHVGSFFIEPILRAHDPARVEVFCYADLIAPDAVTRRLQGYAKHWREIHLLDPLAAAALIQRDQIDILVDLNGHANGNRLAIFGLKPAPVQVTYMGYPNTTGLGTMDYRLTDAWADPPGLTEAFNTEQLVRLPTGFLLYQPPEPCPEVSALPALDRGSVTFGSFNLLAKLSPETVALWAELLQAVPGSRLLLKSKALGDAATAADFLAQFAAHGIAAARLSLVGEVAGFEAHLEAYSQVDIGLDPFPYNGTTTTCEALWMGVPVITLAGGSHVARVGVSLLQSVGLEELIAAEQTDYVAIAARLAGDLPALQALRQGLRARMDSSPLCDGPGFTRGLEAAYRRMWQRWCEPAC